MRLLIAGPGMTLELLLLLHWHFAPSWATLGPVLVAVLRDVAADVALAGVVPERGVGFHCWLEGDPHLLGEHQETHH